MRECLGDGERELQVPAYSPVCLPATELNATSFPIPRSPATNRTGVSGGARLTERRDGVGGGGGGRG